ncbi:2TM domain-containing protein [Flavobacterium sp.]|uniref:2TM domain-containing protein n=1 Tax=Flavobacterium sp. TaxID=239 RepID=UPI0026077BE0|nr:2TM domain-containing protein [Flavobacterium sp.]MDD3003914.1 2TM domain-containing protein [Flavobacterium sp.]
MIRIENEDERRLNRAVKRVKEIKSFYKHLLAYVIVNCFLFANMYFENPSQEIFSKFSTYSTAFFWGIGLFFHAVSVFGKNFFLGDDWEEKKINEYMSKDKRSKWE